MLAIAAVEVLSASIESKGGKPGDFGWDPANIRPKTAEKLEDFQVKELKVSEITTIFARGNLFAFIFFSFQRMAVLLCWVLLAWLTKPTLLDRAQLSNWPAATSPLSETAKAYSKTIFHLTNELSNNLTPFVRICIYDE